MFNPHYRGAGTRALGHWGFPIRQGPSDQMVAIDAEVFSHGCQMSNVTIDAEVFSHGCQILKSPKFSGSNFENFQKRKFPFMEVSHSCQITKNSDFFREQF